MERNEIRKIVFAAIENAMEIEEKEIDETLFLKNDLNIKNLDFANICLNIDEQLKKKGFDLNLLSLGATNQQTVGSLIELAYKFNETA